jgi:hypothetical protein
VSDDVSLPHRIIGAPETLDGDGKPLCGAHDFTFLSIQWGELRYQHTAAIRARLVELYPSASANKSLAALRGVLKQHGSWTTFLMPITAAPWTWSG